MWKSASAKLITKITNKKMNLTKKEKEIIISGLEMYKGRLKKLLRDSQVAGVGEKDIKQAFLQTDQLVAKFME